MPTGSLRGLWNPSNTFIHYVNYRFEIGGDSLRPLVSGNYLLQVYDEDDPDKVLLQARFRVAEDVYRIAGKADGRTDKGFNTEHQQLALTLAPAGRVECNPYTDLMVEITQNGRPDPRHASPSHPPPASTAAGHDTSICRSLFSKGATNTGVSRPCGPRIPEWGSIP